MKTIPVHPLPDCCLDCAGRNDDCGGTPTLYDGCWECALHQRDFTPADEAPADTPASIIAELIDAIQPLKSIGDRIDRTIVRDLIDRAKAVPEGLEHE